MRKKDEFVIGVDEAGMGPVFGPLVVSGAAVLRKDIGALSKIGVKDSKKFGSGLAAHRRRKTVLADAAGVVINRKVVAINPEQIKSGNLYDLHIRAVRSILRSLNWRGASTVYIEQVGGMAREGFLQKLGFWHRGFVYEKKADVNYPAVSLASISAKIERDIRVGNLCRSLGEDFVSGYANKTTEEFFRRYFSKHGRLPPGTRTSYEWGPITEMREGR